MNNEQNVITPENFIRVNPVRVREGFKAKHQKAMDKSHLLLRKNCITEIIRNLSNETLSLLKDIFSSLTNEQLEALKGFYVSESIKIVKAQKDSVILVEDFDETEETVWLCDLKQEEQYELIEFIFNNILK